MSGNDIEPDRDQRRLARQVNRLHRRLQALQARHERETGALARRAAALEEELAAVKRTRVWRAAGRIRALWPRPAPDPPARDRRARQYQAWQAIHALTDERRAALARRYRDLENRPLVSVVMPVYDPPPDALREAIRSVQDQIYGDWELCLVDDGSQQPDTLEVIREIDDPRIRTRRLELNSSIAAATNSAIDMARGAYIAFMDHDDRLAPDALLEVVCCVNDTGADLVYTDEDFLDADGARTDPHFKPDYSPDLLLSHNYITHLVVVERGLVEKAGRLRAAFDGAQDYDFLLRATEQARAVRHVPKVLYHWRMSDASSAMNAAVKPQAVARGREALAQALDRRGFEKAEVADAGTPNFYRVRYPLSGEPLVSIVIPFRDKPDLLHCVVGDVLELSSYGNYRVLGVSNNSTETETREAMHDLSALDPRVRFMEHDIPFNFSAIVNVAAGQAAGEHLVLLNNDIRIISPDWIERLLEHSQRPDVGAVGGKLYYPDGRVQHGGIIVGIDGYAGHAHKGFPGDHQGYFNRLQVVQNVSAVTGAFMMVKTGLFRDAGGFDEERFGTACNDVDFCLRLRERGLWNVFTPHAEAWHVESASRGYEDTPEKSRRYQQERAAFAERHRAVLEGGDPFYNPNLTDRLQDFSLKVPVE